MVLVSGAKAAEQVVRVRGLRKAFGRVVALDGVDLDIARGEVFALVGPNGAGKTSAVEILEGVLDRDAGDVSVLGADPGHPPRGWRERIGVVLQQSEVQGELTVIESLALFAGYYPAPRPVAEVLELAGLAEMAARRAGRLSGGQRRRLDVALALIGDPELLFLDEPTTGFDPAARRHSWEMIGRLGGLGKTVVLTTHYMEEAQRLADRVGVLVAGRIVAEGPPDRLVGEQAQLVIVFRLPAGAALSDLPAELGQDITIDGGRVCVRVAAGMRALHALSRWALERGIELEDFEARHASLEDVFLALTEAP